MPPFDSGYPSRTARPGPNGPGPGNGRGPANGPGPGNGPGWPPAGSGYGYGASPGWRPAPPGAPGPGAQGAPGTPGAPGAPGAPDGGAFDGGYAQVIRPAGHPAPPGNRVPPHPGRPADPAHPAAPDRDVFVYRDVSDPAPRSSGRRSAADDSAYWYDLLAEDPAPQREESRGPFEPLLPSGGAEQAQRPADEGRERSPEAPEQARARKLEQLKDLYLTAEAIGEQNVDKHFDQLLAQQRELISDYFKQSPAARPRDGQAAEADPEHQRTSATSGQATPPEGVSVRAEPPRAW